VSFHTIDSIALLDRPLHATVAEIRAIVGDGPVYVSFDIDFLDPAFAPATGTPVAGGPPPTRPANCCGGSPASRWWGPTWWRWPRAWRGV
jgi:arginase family enzyme